jgi:hypothetical protein
MQVEGVSSAAYAERQTNRVDLVRGFSCMAGLSPSDHTLRVESVSVSTVIRPERPNQLSERDSLALCQFEAISQQQSELQLLQALPSSPPRQAQDC